MLRIKRCTVVDQNQNQDEKRQGHRRGSVHACALFARGILIFLNFFYQLFILYFSYFTNYFPIVLRLQEVETFFYRDWLFTKDGTIQRVPQNWRPSEYVRALATVYFFLSARTSKTEQRAYRNKGYLFIYFFDFYYYLLKVSIICYLYTYVSRLLLILNIGCVYWNYYNLHKIKKKSF